MRSRVNRFAKPKGPTFSTESLLCDKFIAAARESREHQWKVYPETSGWDVLLARASDGFQVGVQAKLRPNVDVLAQANVKLRYKGPDIHAVLVPSCNGAFCEVAEALGIMVVQAKVLEVGASWGVDRNLDALVSKAQTHAHLKGRCWLPPFEPNLPAGVPGPRQVTQWKCNVAQVCAQIRAGEAISRDTAKYLRLDPAQLQPVAGTFKPKLFKVPSWMRLPDVDFPEVSLGLGLPAPAFAASAAGR